MPLARRLPKDPLREDGPSQLGPQLLRRRAAHRLPDEELPVGRCDEDVADDVVALEAGPRTERDLTPSFCELHEPALGIDAETGGSVFGAGHPCEVRPEPIGSGLDDQCTLARRRDELEGVEPFAYRILAAETDDPRCGQDGSVDLARRDLLQPGVDVSPQCGRPHIGTHDPHERLAPGRGRTHQRSLRQIAQGLALAGYQNVARILTRRDGGQNESFGFARGKILRAVHGDVDAVVEERPLQLGGEDTLGTDGLERPVGDGVTGRPYDDDLRLYVDTGAVRGRAKRVDSDPGLR